jgi:SanA protein
MPASYLPVRCYGGRVSTLRRLGRTLTTPLRRFPRTTKALLAIAALGVLFVAFANAYVLLSPPGESSDDPDALPHAQTAIVLGALVEPDGDLSRMLSDRVEGGAELWRAGKVDRILVSGDHGEWIYDEPDAMRMALMRAGVPGRVIFTDHAGFDTWSSMVRAREVFGVESAIVVTQDFHMPRALYLADAAGLEADGLIAERPEGYGRKGHESFVREFGSRVKAFGDATLDSDVMLGPRIPIAGDDGRVSWGPAPPTGTPPAGAPRG